MTAGRKPLAAPNLATADLQAPSLDGALSVMREGDIEVQGTLVLAPSAVVVGKIRCGKFVVYDGASISGSIETIQSPTKQQLEQDAHEDARGVIKLKTGTR